MPFNCAHTAACIPAPRASGYHGALVPRKGQGADGSANAYFFVGECGQVTGFSLRGTIDPELIYPTIHAPDGDPLIMRTKCERSNAMRASALLVAALGVSLAYLP